MKTFFYKKFCKKNNLKKFKLNIMKKTYIIHPFLFVVFPILYLFNHNIAQSVLFYDILLPSIAGLCFAFILILLLWLIFKDWKKAGIIVSIFLVLFFSYGHIFNILRSLLLSFERKGFIIEGHNKYLDSALNIALKFATFIIGKHEYYLLIAACVLFFYGAYFIVKTHKDLGAFTNVLNVIAICLVIISLVNIGIYKFEKRDAWCKKVNLQDTEMSSSENITTYPDIYYIILDSYASPNTLEEIYNYDDSEFINYLSEEGFYIASESLCNYPRTYLSLSSSLNMNYLNDKDQEVLFQMVNNNEVMDFLKTKGYKYINISSCDFLTNYNPYADINIRTGESLGFLTLLIETTMLGYFDNSIVVKLKRYKILDTFLKLEEVYKIEGNKFVLAHIMLPHYPYLFDENGDPVSTKDYDINVRKTDNWGWKQRKHYLNQLTFVNKKVEVIIDNILSKSEVPPIIVLQADHGPDLTSNGFISNLAAENYANSSEILLKERMRILNAYYLPLEGNYLLYDSITPVNTFRLIFNLYFNGNYELLDDKSFIGDTIYDLIDVTDKVKYN